MIRDSDDKDNFPYKLLLTDTQVSRLCKAFTNSSSASIKLSKTNLSKMVELLGFLGHSILLNPNETKKLVGNFQENKGDLISNYDKRINNTNKLENF